MVNAQDFILDSKKILHFTSKSVNYYVKCNSYVYLISPSKKFKCNETCYENYAKQASMRMQMCRCQTTMCWASGMQGVFPLGQEVATYIDDRNVMWVMPSRLTILTMQDKELAFEFLKHAFNKPIRDVVTAVSRTSFYSVLSIQLKQVTVASTKALMNLDLIIFGLFYAIHNELMVNEVFQSYCLSENAWQVLANYDPIWSTNQNSWLSRFLAYDALHANDANLKARFTPVRLPLINSISVPFNVHQFAITHEDNLLLYKNEVIGSVIMDDGESFWLTQPLQEFLASKSLMYSESSQLLIVINTHNQPDSYWPAYFQELKIGRWKNHQQHESMVCSLNGIIEKYL